MAHLASAQQTELYGTARLIAEDNVHGDKKDIVLVPAPSDDPNDPLNWRPLKKYWQAQLIALYALFAGAIIAAPIAGWGFTSADTGISPTELNYGFAISILFLGIGNIFWTPLANTCGRRTVYVIASLGAALCSIWTALYDTRASYYLKSVFLGFFCAPYQGMVLAFVSDMFFLHERGTWLAFIIVHEGIGTDMGTLAAAFISSSSVSYIDWRWCGWIAAILLFAVFFLLCFTFEETRYFRSAMAHQNPAANMTLGEIKSGKGEESLAEQAVQTHEAGRQLPARRTYMRRLALWSLPEPQFRDSLGTQLKELATLVAFPATIWAGLIYGLNVAWFSTLLSMLPTVILAPPYNFTPIQMGYTRFATVAAELLAMVICGPLSDMNTKWLARRNGGIREAEQRLVLFSLGLITMPGGLLIFGFSAYYRAHWFGVVFGQALTAFSYVLTSDLALSYVIDCYRPLALEVILGVVVIRNIIGFSFTFAIAPWLAASNTRDVSITLAVITLVFYGSTWPLWHFGKRLRVWTSTRYPLAGRNRF